MLLNLCVSFHATCTPPGSPLFERTRTSKKRAVRLKLLLRCLAELANSAFADFHHGACDRPTPRICVEGGQLIFIQKAGHIIGPLILSGPLARTANWPTQLCVCVPQPPAVFLSMEAPARFSKPSLPCSLHPEPSSSSSQRDCPSLW